MVRKHIALTASATALTVASMVGAGAAAAAPAHAQSQSKTSTQRKLTASEREARYDARLATAVSEGKLTAEQKAAVLTEHTKLEAAYSAAKLQTGDARKTAVRQVWNDAKTWATANNVNVKYLIGFKHHMKDVITN